MDVTAVPVEVREGAVIHALTGSSTRMHGARRMRSGSGKEKRLKEETRIWLWARSVVGSLSSLHRRRWWKLSLRFRCLRLVQRLENMRTRGTRRDQPLGQVMGAKGQLEFCVHFLFCVFVDWIIYLRYRYGSPKPDFLRIMSALAVTKLWSFLFDYHMIRDSFNTRYRASLPFATTSFLGPFVLPLERDDVIIQHNTQA